MRILVLLRQILDPRGLAVNRRAGKVFVNREEYIINPADRGALELALRLRDADLKLNGSGQGLEVVAAALGPDRVETALRDALALQVDRAIRLADPAFDKADAAVTARALRALTEYIGGCDLVVLGEEVLDSGDHQTGPRLSALLDCPLIGGAVGATLLGDRVQAQRRVDTIAETVESTLPAVLVVRPWALKPRYPHGANILNAYRQGVVEQVSAADLNLLPEDLQSALESRGQDFPAERELGTVVDGPLSNVLEQVGTVLKRYRR